MRRKARCDIPRLTISASVTLAIHAPADRPHLARRIRGHGTIDPFSRPITVSTSTRFSSDQGLNGWVCRRSRLLGRANSLAPDAPRTSAQPLLQERMQKRTRNSGPAIVRTARRRAFEPSRGRVARLCKPDAVGEPRLLRLNETRAPMGNELRPLLLAEEPGLVQNRPLTVVSGKRDCRFERPPCPWPPAAVIAEDLSAVLIPGFVNLPLVRKGTIPAIRRAIEQKHALPMAEAATRAVGRRCRHYAAVRISVVRSVRPDSSASCK